jgi:Nif-specific regulatory protein
MVPTLIAIGGPFRGAVFSLNQAEISVGRDHANSVALSDPAVSPRQCILACRGSDVTIRDVDLGNPTFVNGLPADGRTLQPGDQIRIGSSIFVLSFGDPGPADSVQVDEDGSAERFTIVMSREDAITDQSAALDASIGRLTRDLVGLMRINAAINAVRGLVALERPLIELIAEVVPASRGAVILSGDSIPEIASAVWWDREAGVRRPLRLSRTVIQRVLREGVGVMSEYPETASRQRVAGPDAARCALAAPLVAFDKLLGAIYLESDSLDHRFDEGHLRLLMSIAAAAATALAYERHVELLADENRRLQTELEVDHDIVGDSPAMRDVYRRIGRVAPTDSTVLITGESGTGKELVARAIHRNSPRAEHPFVAINCAAITETLLESELFGHEKGAFTGAIGQKKGKIEAADGGTLFLDEVAELSLPLQAKLLRVLQEREFERVGGTRRVRVNFRLVAATNGDLEGAIGRGAFRKDLYYRLNVVSVEIPALRDRPEDITLLAKYFARRYARKATRRVAGFSAESLACLTAYDWPGNVRELENAIERAVVLGSTELILPDDLPDAVVEAAAASAGHPAPDASASARFHDAIKQAKRELIVKAFDASGGNHNSAARLLQLHPNYLHRLIRNLDLKPSLKKPR